MVCLQTLILLHTHIITTPSLHVVLLALHPGNLLLRQQAVAVEERLDVGGEELLAEVLGAGQEVPQQIPGLVHQQRGQHLVGEPLAGARRHRVDPAELDRGELGGQAVQAAVELLAALDPGLVDVHHHHGGVVLLLDDLQEGVAAVQLMHALELGPEAELLVHLLHAALAVLLQTCLVFLLEQFVLLNTYLKPKPQEQLP